MVRSSAFFIVLLLGMGEVAAEQVTITGGTVYVTRNDCAAVTEHRPAPDATYRPGVDVHGKYVPPADLPGNNYSNVLPDKVHFDVQINPMTYGPGANAGQGAGGTATTSPANRFANTALPVAHLDVDLKTGQVFLNGQPLSGPQNSALLEACRKAGFR